MEHRFIVFALALTVPVFVNLVPISVTIVGKAAEYRTAHTFSYYFSYLSTLLSSQVDRNQAHLLYVRV